MDFLRRYEHRHVDYEVDPAEAADSMQARDADTSIADDTRLHAALAVFMELPTVQRSALALKDVLGLSLEEAAATMGTTIAAVKGALVRARANVNNARTRMTPDARRPSPNNEADMGRLRVYANLFNARDWDGLRALFGEETRLDLVSRHQLKGPPAAEYFNRYAAISPREDLRAEVGWVGDVAVVAVFRPSTSTHPAYFIRLDWGDDRVSLVRDFRHVPYIGREAAYVSAS